MGYDLSQETEKLNQEHRKRRNWKKFLSILACIVVFCTVYSLILPAITEEEEVYCSIEEHSHDNKCYERQLVCDVEESAGEPHEHTDACYEEEKELICQMDESEEHIHTDECYTVHKKLICGLEDGELAGDHTHTDECYEQVLVCEKEEHEHDLSCFSNPEADVESTEVWERIVSNVELTGEWAEDVISVAETQLGYQESTHNYIVLMDGKTKKGYTRYGDWYGDKYGDWCAMFVSFCLNYAEIPEEDFPREASCARWIEKLEEDGLYVLDGEYFPCEGDLVFFDQNGDGTADHVGLVYEQNFAEDGSTITGITTIEGNCSDKVQTAVYDITESKIVGYGKLPQNPEQMDAGSNENIYTYEDPYLSVTAVPEKADALPENAQLKVTQVDAESTGYNYDAYMQALNDSSGEENTYTAENTLLYDIAFFTGPDGEESSGTQEELEIQPTDGQVSISITFKDGQLSRMGSGDDTGTDTGTNTGTGDGTEVGDDTGTGTRNETGASVQVVHLPLTKEVREQIHTTSDATDICAGDVEVEAISAQVTDSEISFQMDGFSLVAFVTNQDGTVEEITGEDVEPGTTRTYQGILGDAVYYGITATTVSKVAHMDSNFAAKMVTTNGGDVTAGKYTNEGRGGSFVIGAMTGSLQIHGGVSVVFTTKDAGKLLDLKDGSYSVYDDQSHLNQLVSDMIGYVEEQSNAMFAERSYEVLTYGMHWNGSTNVTEWYSDQNDKTLDISGYPAGTYYINGDDFLLKSDVQIRKNSDQTIVFNLSGTDVALKQFRVTNVDKGQTIDSANSNSTAEPFASTIVFNAPNADSVEIQSAIVGVLIAPKATVTIRSTSSGWIVANEVTNPGGEWHFVSQIIPESIAIVNIDAKKNVDGQPATDSQRFTFVLESWDGSIWTDQRTVENKAENICFQNRYEQTGTYYYRLSEVLGTDSAYDYDTTKYVIKVEVKSNTGTDGKVSLTSNLTYYKSTRLDECTSDKQISDLTFSNTTTEEPDDSGYILPETGGMGIAPFATGGTVMLLCVGILLLYRHKEYNKRDNKKMSFRGGQ